MFYLNRIIRFACYLIKKKNIEKHEYAARYLFICENIYKINYYFLEELLKKLTIKLTASSELSDFEFFSLNS